MPEHVIVAWLEYRGNRDRLELEARVCVVEYRCDALEKREEQRQP